MNLAFAFPILALWSVAPAAASTIHYAWTGTVTFVDPISPATVVVGQKIGITLDLDSTVPDQDPSPNRGLYDQQLQQPVLVQSVDFGGVTGVGAFQLGTVRADDGGMDQFMISTGDQHIGARFVIDFETSHPGVLASDALPLAIDPMDFETATFFVNGPDNLQPLFFPRFSGTIDALRVAQTPLPGSAAMFAPALAGLLGFAAWQRRGAAT